MEVPEGQPLDFTDGPSGSDCEIKDEASSRDRFESSCQLRGCSEFRNSWTNIANIIREARPFDQLLNVWPLCVSASAASPSVNV